MKKIFLLIFIILLIIPVVHADRTAKGYVILDIVNRPPELRDVRLSTPEIYADTEFDCLAEPYDEFPEELKIKKEWFVNGNKVDSLDVNAGDEVTCVLTPVDVVGEEGPNYSLTFEVQQKPLGMMLTGFVVGGEGETPMILFVMVFIITLLIVLAIRELMIYKLKTKNETI